MENPLVILDWKTNTIRKKVIGLVKVQWQHSRARSELGSQKWRSGHTILSCLLVLTFRMKFDQSEGEL